MAEVLFTFSNVTNDRVKKINLTIEKNENIILFGPSGAGKSSLLCLFNRLHVPLDGEISYKGKPIEEYRITNLRKEVGMVFQQANLFPGTVFDNLKFGPELSGQFCRRAADELMQFVQLPSKYLDREASLLSGGEQQRVNLARTLANRPEVLLLDEPTSALDKKTSAEIEKLLIKLVEDKKKTLIMVTHDLNQARRVGTKGIFMDNGRLIETGSLENLLIQPKSERLQKFMVENG